MLVTLPFVLLLLDYWPLGRCTAAPGARPPWFLVLEKIPLLALAAASSAVTLWAQRSGEAMRTVEGFPLAERWSNAAVAYVTYLWKTVWPRDLAVFYPHPGAGLPPWKVGASLLVLILITAVALRARRRSPYLIVGWLGYLGTLVPVIGLVQVGSQSMADRYTYLPLIGLFVIVAWGLPDALRRLGGWLVVPAAIVIVALSVSTRAQLEVWRTSETLFEHALEVTERNYVAHNNLGIVAAEGGRLDEAIGHYEAAVRIQPNHAPLHVNLANALVKQSRHDEAYRHYRRALELDADSADAHYNLGSTLAVQGRFEEAIAHYNEALRVDPDDPRAHNNLGSALARQGELDRAVDHFRRAIRLDPDHARAHANLAASLFLLERYEEAWAEVRASRRLGFEPPAELVRALAESMPEP
jgi:tetratricopeptide (TPR) repeat protein